MKYKHNREQLVFETNVFKYFLEIIYRSRVPLISVFGRLFHSLEAQTVKILSPALFLVNG